MGLLAGIYGKWSAREGQRPPVTMQKTSLKTLNINQVLQEQTRLQYSAVEWTKNKRAVTDVLAPAHALRPHVTSVAGQAKFFVQCQTVVTKLE